MEDNSCKSKYQKFKLRVKLWEKDFKRKHNRVPSKYDIREAPQEVKDSYKMYYKLKTTLLEDTLNDVLSDDGFDIMEMSTAEPGLEANAPQNSEYFEGSHLPTSITSLLTNDFCTSQGITESRKENIRIPNIAKTDKDPKEATKVFHSVEEFPLNSQAWCNEKKKSPEVVKKKELNLKHKLFQSSSFSKRNPRKSLIRNKLQNSNQNTSIEKICNGNTNEILPDLQTILLEKAKEQQTNKDVAINTDTKENKDTLKIHVDKQWLQRTSQRNGVMIESMNESVTEESSCSDFKYGLTNINITKLLEPSNTTTNQESTKDLLLSNEENNLCESRQKNNYESEADSIINDSEDDDQASYRHIVKRRRLTDNTSSTIISVPSTTASIGNKKIHEKKDEIEENNNRARKVLSKNSHKTSEKSKKSTIKMVKSVPKTSVRKKGNSNCTNAQAHKKKRKGAERKSKRIQSPTNDKRCDQTAENNMYEEDQEQPPAIEDLHTILSLERVELTCLPRLNELDDLNNLAQKYIEQTCNPSNTPCTPSLSIKDEKISTARRKLEDKIAAGKLNENFVTINIQKKKFVRGKKSINYSRYKKKLWKNKKRIAALSGPDMDMGGCDGGTLKCFTCGQAGHFAQNCKVKGDQLLPLTAQLEDDPSPFPTLKEAELMARQATLTAHNGNTFKIPQAGNMALLNKEQLEDDEKEASISHQIINGNNQNENESEGEGEGEGEGHMKNQNNIYYQNSLLHENDEEILAFDVEKAIQTHDECANFTKKYVGHKIPEAFLKAAGFATTSNHSFIKHKTVQPLYELNPNDTSEPEVTPEVIDALHMFGHTTFRKGQDRAIMRILSGLSTLVTLSTGSGKSLCYQLPAYLYARRKGCITLVISPLVSLMEDQVTGVPHFLRAHCLHTNQTPQQKLKVMDLITKGEVDILLVSPEGVVAGERSTGFGSILRKLPPIAFACIDEAHCVSQWSHNFRPSYLMICKILQQNLGVKCILGLTATATLPTRLNIIKHLGIEDGDRGIISDVPLPDNLILSVSKDENRDNALLELLVGERFAACHSIIIYCTRRDECERVAGFLRTTLHDHRPDEESSEGNKRKRKRTRWHVEPYHAGLAASRRRTVQNAFMKNELRIVVATVAFGMGINKPDIRAVIHYNMPRNFESYVQEVGRAGRDNRISHCHLLLDANGNDKYELRRHIYANSIDRHVIRKLLQRIFVPCACSRNNNTDNTEKTRSCGGHEIGFSIEETVQALDIPAENIATLLCYMELDNRWCINVLSNAYIKAKVISYGGPKYLKHAAKECPPLATAVALHIKNGSFQANNSIVEFSVIDIAAAIGWNSGVVKYQLKNLEWIHVNGQWKRSPITVKFFDLGFRLKVPGDFTTEEIDEALDTLYNRSLMQEHTQLKQLQYIYQGLSSVTYNTYKLCSSENFATDRSEQLKAIIRDYFQNDCPRDVTFEIEFSSIKDEDVINDINSLINMYPDNNFSGRTIARIFHGISSPNYPAVMWHRCKYWRIYSKINFNRIIQLANNVLVCRR